MKKRKLHWKVMACAWTLLSLLILSYQSFAQNQTAGAGEISGTVLSKSGEQIAGATITISGTSTSVVSDQNGAFSIAAKPSQTLLISYVGYNSVSLKIDAATNNLKVELTEVFNKLSEVVVIGFGTQKRKYVTGSTVSVKGGDLQNNHTLSVAQALQGQAAGVQVTSNSGQPGESLKIRVRGAGTNGDPNPLYVVDGMVTSDISYLNSADIETIDILKDAASAAIYGTQAANGVVLITTKKGRAGRKDVTFDTYLGFQNPVNTLDVLNAKDYKTLMNEAALNSGKLPYFYYSQADIDTTGKGTDWQKEVTNKNALMQNYNLGFSGGNDQSLFSSSLGYQRQEGLVGMDNKSYYERFTFRINSEHNLYKNVVILGENLTYAHSNQSGIGTGNIYGNSIRGLLNTSPLFSPKNADGTYAFSPNSEEINPVAALDYLNNNKTVYDKMFGDVYTEVFILKDLKFRSDFGVDISYNTYNKYTPLYRLSATNNTNTTTAEQGMYKNFTWNWDNTLTYAHSFGNHNLNVLAGISAKEYNFFFVDGSKQDLIISSFDNAVINSGTNATTQKAFGTRSENTLQSYFGRVLYNYNETYLFSASLRRDGSSRFGENHKYGYFPAASVGWVATNENFLKLSWLNFLKIRASWGKNGSDRIGDFKYLPTVSSSFMGYYFGGANNPTASVGTSPDKIANRDLQWESTEQSDIGFDATLFKNLTINFDWYNKETQNWLVQPPIPDIVGTGAPFINGGNIQNRGIEIGVNYHKNLGEFNFNIGGNLALNKNKVLSVPNQDGIIHGANNVLSSSTQEFYRIQTGFPIAYFWGYQSAGIFQNMNDVNSYKNKSGTLIQPNAKPGDIIFVDKDGDGAITIADKTQIGNPNPSNTYGINLGADYKGFDFSVMISGVGGNSIVNGTRATDRYYNNYSTEIIGRWHGEGTSNKIPRLTLGDEANGNYTNFSDLYVEDGSFARVKSINLGYDFKKYFLANSSIQQFRLYVSGQNLLTFTNYKGTDPEVGYGYTESDNSSWSTGIDLGNYPLPKTIIIGLNVRF